MVPHIGNKILSSFWGIVSYRRNIILLGLTTKKTATQQKVGVRTMVLQIHRNWEFPSFLPAMKISQVTGV